MDFSKLSTTDQEKEMVLPGGVKTGFHLILRSESSPEVQAVTKKYRNKLMAEQRKGKRGNPDKVTDLYEENRVIAHVAGWRWDAESKANWQDSRPEFSAPVLKEMLAHREFSFYLKEFITDEIGDAADFLESSGTS